MTDQTYLELLNNHIDITHVPFSDRGSRLLVFREPQRYRLYIKLAERLTDLEPDIEAYLKRPPFMRDICLIDEQGEVLDFDLTTSPHLLTFRTRLGDFGLAFQDQRTLAFGLPPDVTAGIRFHVSPQFWQKTPVGGSFKSVRNVGYSTNADIVSNQILPDAGGYTVELMLRPAADSSVALTVQPGHDLFPEALPFSTCSRAAEARWRSWFESVPAGSTPGTARANGSRCACLSAKITRARWRPCSFTTFCWSIRLRTA